MVLKLEGQSTEEGVSERIPVKCYHSRVSSGL